MQGADDLVFSLDLNPARKESSEDDVAEWVDKRQLTFGCMKWCELAARHQQRVVDNVGKGHGKVGGQLDICQNKPVKAVKTKDNLPSGQSMCEKNRTGGQASAVGD